MDKPELCNDGRCRRVRLGEERHPLHIIMDNQFFNIEWKKFLPTSTSKKILKETQTLQKQKTFGIHLILGIIIIIAGLFFFITPISNDRPEVDRWSGFDLVRQENVTLSSLSFNIVTLEEVQYLHIFYSTNEIHGETPFLMFIIPYLGIIVNPQGDQYSIPEEWKTYRDPGLKTTILYKFFDCTEKKYCNDQLNMYFDFDYKIDSKQYYTHSINIPFLSSFHPPLTDAINKILKDIPNSYWEKNWGLREGKNPILTVSVIDASTQYNDIPDGYLKSHKYNRTGVTNSVMVWDVPEHAIDFHLDIVNPHEKYYYDNLRTIAVVLFATGTAFLTISFSEYFSQKKFN